MNCSDCQYYVWRPAAIEREFQGLKILSSAYGSVCAGSGYCQRHDRMQRSLPACSQFALAVPEAS